MRVPTLVESSHASHVFGGITVTWPAEAAAHTEKNPSVGNIVLRPKKVSGFVYLSNEFMEDSTVQIETFLRKSFGAAIAYYADEAYLVGDGVFQPLGILNAPCTISQTKETDQPATTLVWENVLNMDARLLPQSQRKALWLLHPDTKPELYAMTASAQVRANINLAGGPDGMWMYGHQIIPTEKCKTLGTVGDIMLADFSQYVIGDRGLAIAASSEYSFNTDETCWKFVLRTDGQPIPSSAITPKNGSTTTSPFVTLATRA